MRIAENADRRHPLLRWTLKIRELQEEERRLAGSDSTLHLWLIQPVAELLAFFGLLVLTCFAGMLSPRLLYVGKPANASNEKTNKPLFLDYRAVVLALLAMAQISSGENLMEEEFQNVEEPVVRFALSQFFYLVVAFLFVAVGAMSIWIGARVVAIRLTFGRAMRISGYSLGSGGLAIVSAVPVGTGLGASAVWALDGRVPDFVVYAVLVLVAVAVLSCVAHVTFIAPMSVLHPEASKRRIWLGWSIGPGCAVTMLVVLAVVFGVSTIILHATGASDARMP